MTLLALHLHTAQDDEALQLAAAADGDPAGQAWLVRRWTAPMYRFCYRMLRNEQDARDAAQDTLSKVLRNMHRYDQQRKFSTWIYGIARNTCIDEFRKRKRRAWDEPPDVQDDGPTPLQLASSAERADHLRRALDQLAPLYREVLVMYHFDHLKYVEIAETLDIPLGTVMNRIFRARKKLRVIVDGMGGLA